MSSFCTAKATHIFFSKKFQHICVSLDVNFNESLTNDVVSFEQLGPDVVHTAMNDKKIRLLLIFILISIHYLKKNIAQGLKLKPENNCTHFSY